MADRPAAQSRIRSIDALRGLIMIVMALDHVRDFFHLQAAQFQPENLARTSAPLFFTRWITHFCAPVFFCYAGLGAFFWGRSRSRAELARFLVSRGLWLILLEVTAERFFLFANFDYSVVLLIILWALGCSMIALAGMIWLGDRSVLAISAAMLLLHNLLDGIRAARFGPLAWLWNVLHQPGAIRVGSRILLAGYPLIPWIGVMGFGYALGNIFTLDAPRRRTLLLRIGFSMSAAFLLLRALNVYGDPSPWSVQRSPLFTLLSFLNCTKYPVSLDFVLMTLGPALMLAAWLDRFDLGRFHPLPVYGRVPLFYFLLHLALIHFFAALADQLLTGRTYLWTHPPPGMRFGQLTPYGYPLWVCYAVWAGLVVLLYPVCRWYGELKRRRHDWWLSYL